MVRPAPLAALLALLAAPALAEPPRVVADIAPVQSLLAQVMEGVATPELLIGQEANPHSVQLRPSQARALANADLLVWVGPALEPWLGDAATSLGGGDQIVLLARPETHLRHFAEAQDDHADEAAMGDEHGHGDTDPHAWLSPANARAWLGLFAEELAARDPDNAATYRANAAKAQAGIDALSARISKELAPFAGAEIVTFHAAFGYFTDSFGIGVAGSVRPGDAATPSAAALGELRNLVAFHNVRCAFAEPGFDPALLKAIAGETGLKLGEVDPIGASFEPGADHYRATLEAIGGSIAACLGAD